jgi:hypothetical protein
MVEDFENPRQRWRFISQSAGKLVLIASVLITLSLIFGVDLRAGLGALGY